MYYSTFPFAKGKISFSSKPSRTPSCMNICTAVMCKTLMINCASHKDRYINSMLDITKYQN